MESFNEFMERISSFEVPTFGIDTEHFVPGNAVLQKVNLVNRFSQFFGDTIVFDLSDDDKKRIEEISKTLRRIAPECFSERLYGNTFHMTLHDLSSGRDELAMMKQMELNLSEIKSRLKGFSIPQQDIRMKTNNIINMVDTSVVLALRPASEEDYDALARLYQFFDEIVKLSYKFTPHITLGYYNRNGFSHNSGELLKKVVEDYNQCGFDIVLNTSNLCYQRFTSMNDYVTILQFNK